MSYIDKIKKGTSEYDIQDARVPEVKSQDNGKFLKNVDGDLQFASVPTDDPRIPTPAAQDSGKSILVNSQGAYELGNVSLNNAPANLSMMKSNPSYIEVDETNCSSYKSSSGDYCYYCFPLDGNIYIVNVSAISDADYANSKTAVFCAQLDSSIDQSTLTSRNGAWNTPGYADCTGKFGVYFGQELVGTLNFYICNGFIYAVETGK